MVRGKKDFLYSRFLSQLKAIDSTMVKKIPPVDYRALIRDCLWVIESEGPDSQGSIVLSQGTGFTLNGYGIVTCNHVIIGSVKVYKASAPQITYSAKVEKQNKDLDVAILTVHSPVGEGLERELKRPIREDDDLILAGFPSFAAGHSGIIERCHVIGSHSFYEPKRFFISHPIIAGNSGGPVLNLDLRVVGIAVTGADSLEQAVNTERHVIPIEVLNALTSADTGPPRLTD